MFGNVIECGRLFGDQYLYVVADIASLRKPVIDRNDRVAFPADLTAPFQNRPEHNIAAIWGGASKGVIFSLMMKNRMGHPVTTVIDINPAKQGRYLPVTGLRVQPPQSPGKAAKRFNDLRHEFELPE